VSSHEQLSLASTQAKSGDCCSRAGLDGSAHKNKTRESELKGVLPISPSPWAGKWSTRGQLVISITFFDPCRVYFYFFCRTYRYFSLPDCAPGGHALLPEAGFLWSPRFTQASFLGHGPANRPPDGGSGVRSSSARERERTLTPDSQAAVRAPSAVLNDAGEGGYAFPCLARVRPMFQRMPVHTAVDLPAGTSTGPPPGLQPSEREASARARPCRRFRCPVTTKAAIRPCRARPGGIC